MEGLSQEVLQAERSLIIARRRLHEHAEISFREYETTLWLETQLNAIPNVRTERVTKTGVIAKIEGTKPGTPYTVGIRADIDALPMQEEPIEPFCSKNDGAMHSCGHDGHAAILLTAVRLLAESRDTFCGEVRCFFQHAEELPPGGAIEMVRAGAAKGVDVMLALHLSSNFPTGAHGVKNGVLTANVDSFGVVVRGKGGHCAFPEQCKDPVVAAAAFILQAQTIVARRTAARESVALSICEVHGGTAYNIIPNEVVLNASVRTFGKEQRRKVREAVHKIAEGVATANDVMIDIDWLESYPSVENDAALAGMARKLILGRYGEEKLLEMEPIMPGEDFSYFLADGTPGFFLELGSGNADKGCAFPHHNSKYRMDEDALAYGVQFELDAVRALLDGTGRIIGEAKRSK
ncbi:MAG: amidohydrolase [Clostridia bacterium]|nr:amidohydrolase [Clostridia bacterium]